MKQLYSLGLSGLAGIIMIELSFIAGLLLFICAIYDSKGLLFE